eukprot:7170260-Heterocapsa_arctica.AAC.1
MPAFCGPNTAESSGTVVTFRSPTGAPAKRRPLATLPCITASSRLATLNETALLLMAESKRNHIGAAVGSSSHRSGSAMRSPS